MYPVSPRYLPRFHAAAAAAAASIVVRVRLAPSPTATAAAYSQFCAHHAHSHSMTTVHVRAPSPVVVDTFTPIVIAASGGGGGGTGDSLQSNESMLPSPLNLLSAGSGLPAPSSLSSRCDAGINLIRWEDGSGRRGEDKGEDGTTTTGAKPEAAKTEEVWVAVQDKKALPDGDVVSQPAWELLLP